MLFSFYINFHLFIRHVFRNFRVYLNYKILPKHLLRMENYIILDYCGVRLKGIMCAGILRENSNPFAGKCFAASYIILQ